MRFFHLSHGAVYTLGLFAAYSVNPMDNPKILAIATVVVWSLFTPVVKFISIKSQFLFVTFCFALTTLTFLTGLLVREKSTFRSLAKKVEPQYLFFGLFGYFIYYMGLIQCLREFSSASGSSVLNYTWPVFTVIFTDSVFHRKSKTLGHRLIEIFGLLLGFVSVFILATNGDVLSFEFTHVKGLLWGLLAGASYGFFSGYSSRVPSEGQNVFLLVSASISLLFMLPFGLSEFHLLGEITWKNLAAIVIIGAVFDGGGYFLWTSANRTAKEKGVDISAVASIIFFLPLLSVILISIFYRETELSHPYFLLVLALLISGSFLCQRAESIADRIKPGWLR